MPRAARAIGGERCGWRRSSAWFRWAYGAASITLALFAGTFGNGIVAICTSLFYAFTVMWIYLALEPQVRRRWPHTLISWTSLMTSRWKDPIVGRDVLLVLRWACRGGSSIWQPRR